MPDFSKNVDVSALSSYSAAPQVDLSGAASESGTWPKFVPDQYLFVCEAADGVVMVSFDGKNDHLKLVGGKPNEAIADRRKCQRVWLKKVSGTNPVTVHVMASTDV